MKGSPDSLTSPVDQKLIPEHEMFLKPIKNRILGFNEKIGKKKKGKQSFRKSLNAVRSITRTKMQTRSNVERSVP